MGASPPLRGVVAADQVRCRREALEVVEPKCRLGRGELVVRGTPLAPSERSASSVDSILHVTTPTRRTPP
jgi:hypothetical protein